MPAPAVEYVCRGCGGSALRFEATVEWDRLSQGWQCALVPEPDRAHCDDCKRIVVVDEVLIRRFA